MFAALSVLALLSGAIGVTDEAVRVDTGLAPDIEVGVGSVHVEDTVDIDLDAGHVAVGVDARPLPVADAPPDPVPKALSTSAVATGAAVGVGALWFLGRLLMPLAGAALFSRIQGDAVLDHPSRRAALDFIKANPGAAVRDVQRHLGIAWGTTVHHLRRLCDEDQLVSEHAHGRRRFWLPGQKVPRLPARAAHVASCIQARPGTTPSDLAERLGWSRPTVSKHLGRLLATGHVRVEHHGRTRAYFPATA